jgi:hypothetical protein
METERIDPDTSPTAAGGYTQGLRVTGIYDERWLLEIEAMAGV